MSFYLRFYLVFSLFQICFSNAWCQVKNSAAPKRFVVGDILPQGNRITRASIIFRELTFKKGDTLIASQWASIAERSKENLMNCSLFTSAELDTIRLASGELDVLIVVQERWYLWPSPIFRIEERNFNTWWVQDDHRLDKVDYGAYLTYYNMFGLKQTLKLEAQFGYTQQFAAGYIIPYINKKQAGGLAFNFSYSKNHEIPYTSVNNELIYLNTPEHNLKKEYTGTIDYTYRQGLYNTNILEADIFSCSINDTLLKLTNNYLPFNVNNATFFEAKYFFKRDMRNYAPYPTKGYYLDFSLNEYGMGIKIDNKPFNLFYVQTSFHKYWDISPRLFYSAEVEGKVSQNGVQPYYLQRGLGYASDFVRGYELYVVDGNDFVLVKNEVKFRLFNVPMQPLPFTGMSQFNKTYYAVYLTAFTDWGYVGSANPDVKNNFLAATPLWGNGFGLDFVTYYDLVFRLEYSFNKLNQSGFFLHFVAPM